VLPRCTIIGSGNLGSHLVNQLIRRGQPPLAVWSRTEKPYHDAWRKAGITVAHSEVDLPLSGWFILAVPDGQIAALAQQLARPDRIFIHTSGSISIEVLPGPRAGVFYPLQTFSEKIDSHWPSIPCFLESRTPEDMAMLQSLSDRLGCNWHPMTSEQRRKLHLAAVITNNFTNHLVALAKQYAAQQGLDYTWLLPLMQQTLERLATEDPEVIQTGPARRGDRTTIQAHLDLLSNHPELAHLYQLMSQSIARHYGKEL
jgi:predicted short-subunit dehydrogenase-like oxidoreductase (DUF2520 family)